MSNEQQQKESERGRTILITGASGGIGAEFLKHYSANTCNAVHALDREWKDDNRDAETTPRQSHVQRWTCDLSNDKDLEPVIKGIQARDEQTGPEQIDLVIHCAAVRGLNSSIPMDSDKDANKRETLEAIDADLMRNTFNINCVGAYNLLRAIVPFLREDGASPPRVVIVGSRMGSLARNTPSISGEAAGGAYAYRASKAALNAVVRSFASDFPKALWIVVHPGRVNTGLVPVKEEGSVTVEESVKDMLDMLEAADLKSGENGRFVDRFGEDVPW